MKRFLRIGLVIIFTLPLFGCAGTGKKSGTQDVKPEIMVSEALKLHKKGVVLISGQGFSAESEIMLLFTTNDGVQADIGYALDPSPVVSKEGTWSTNWSYGRFVAKKLVNEGDFELIAVDQDFNPLCTFTVQFVN